MKRFLLLLFAANSALAASTRDPPRHFTLQASIEEAIRNATLVLKSENAEELSGEALLQGYVEFLPNLSLTGSYGYTTGKTLVTTTLPTVVDEKLLANQFAVSTTLNIFNGFADWANLKSSIERKHASELSLSWAKQQVAVDVTQSFLQVTLDQEIVDIARKNLQASQARLKLLQGQADVGAATMADLYRQQAQTATDEQYLISSQSKQVDDQLVLVQKLRLDPVGNYSFDPPPLQPETLPEVGKDQDALIAEAVDAREDLRSEEHTLNATDWDITRQRSGYFPRLDLSLSRNAAGTYFHSLLYGGVEHVPPSQQSLGAQLGNQVQWTTELTLTWNIFDRFVTRLGVSQAQTIQSNTTIDRDNLKIQIGAEIRQIVNDYNTAVHNLESAEVGLAAAKKAYEVIEGRYRTGVSTFIDLLAAQATFVQASSTQAQALINLKLQENLVKYYLGKYRW